ncbi:hypothetical protein [Cognatiyoonia sp.]|uniref:hypothetical protein n=1 Tax=Cognatiyoonia sp. TaxID=2211652 RepID=UPI003F697CB4
MDDIAPEGALHAYFLRSPVAHGTIEALDVSDERDVEVVEAVFTIADLETDGIDITQSGSLVTPRDGRKGVDPMRPLLAKDHVRYVGEPVALILAETMAAAKDAAELI